MSNIIYTMEVPAEVVAYVQTIDLEKKARENLILTIITAGIDPTSDNAKFYYDEYIDYSIKYNLAMEEIQSMYVPKDIVSSNTTWTLDYATNILSVESNKEGCKNGCKC